MKSLYRKATPAELARKTTALVAVPSKPIKVKTTKPRKGAKRKAAKR